VFITHKEVVTQKMGYFDNQPISVGAFLCTPWLCATWNWLLREGKQHSKKNWWQCNVWLWVALKEQPK